MAANELLDSLLAQGMPSWQQDVISRAKNPYTRQMMTEMFAPEPEIEPIKTGFWKQLGYGVSDLPTGVYNRISASLGGKEVEKHSPPIGLAENLGRIAGGIISTGVMFSLAPVAGAVQVGGAAIGKLIAPILGAFGLNAAAAVAVGKVTMPLATKIGTAGAAGAFAGGLTSYANKKNVLGGAASGLVVGAGLSTAGEYLKSDAFAGVKGALAERISGKNVLEKMSGTSVSELRNRIRISSDATTTAYLEAAMKRLESSKHLLPEGLSAQISDVLKSTSRSTGDRISDAIIAGENNIYGKLIFRDAAKEIGQSIRAIGYLGKTGNRVHAALSRVLDRTTAPTIRLANDITIKEGRIATQLKSLDTQMSKATKNLAKVIDEFGPQTRVGRTPDGELQVDIAQQIFSETADSIEKARIEVEGYLGNWLSIAQRRSPLDATSLTNHMVKKFAPIQAAENALYSEAYPDASTMPHVNIFGWLKKYNKIGEWKGAVETKAKALQLYGVDAADELDDIIIGVGAEPLDVPVAQWVKSLIHEGQADLAKTGKILIPHAEDISLIDVFDLTQRGSSIISPTRNILGKPIADAWRKVDVAMRTAKTEISTVLNPIYRPFIPRGRGVARDMTPIIKVMETIDNVELGALPLFDKTNPTKFISWKTLTPEAQTQIRQVGERLGLLAVDATDDVAMQFADVVRAAQGTRHVLDGFSTLMNVGSKSTYLQKYFPHVIKRIMSGKMSTKQLDKIMQLSGRVNIRVSEGKVNPKTGKRVWQHLIERKKADLNPAIHETNVYDALRQYFDTGLRTKFMVPTKNALKPLVKLMDPLKLAYYNSTVNSLGGQPGAGTEGLKNILSNVYNSLTGKELTTGNIQGASAFVTNLQYHGTVWGNPFTAVKNLTQQILSVFQLDDTNPAVGLKYWVEAKKLGGTEFGKWLRSMNPIIGSRQYAEGMRLQQDILAKIPAPAEWASKQGFEWFRKSDIENVNTSFMMKFLHSMDMGQSATQALDEATTFTMSTQFMYGFDSPKLFKDEVGRQLGILMSWQLNWGTELAKQASKGEYAKIGGTLAGMALASEALNLTGFNFRSIYPTEVATKWLPVAMLTDEDNWPGLPKVAAYGIDILMNAIKGEDEQVREEAYRKFKRSLMAFVPGGVPGSRLVNFAADAIADWKRYDTKGRLRYELNTGDGIITKLTGIPGESIRGLIGPTTEGMKRSEAMDLANSLTVQYRRNRYNAINAYIKEDTKAFSKYQSILEDQFGSPVDEQDIQAELELRTKTALIRRLQTLPSNVRDQILEEMGVELTKEDPFISSMNKRLAKLGIAPR